MTSLAHFEKIAGALALPGKAVIDGQKLAAVNGVTFDNV